MAEQHLRERTATAGLEIDMACQLFAETMAGIPQVLCAACLRADEKLDLWVIADGDLMEAEHIVTAYIRRLLQRFPDLDIDFLVLPRGERDPATLLPAQATILFCRRL